jgi:hypothetical protein
MIRTRLYPILPASVALTCLIAILPGCQKAEAQQPAKPAVSAKTEPAVAPTEPSLPPATSNVLSNIPSAEAQQHIGETATVCGLVASARFLESAKGQPTFLNFDHPFPDHTFTVAIFARDRSKFSSPPETMYDGKNVCVTGSIIDYRGKAEIVVKDPSQIVIQEAAPAVAGGTSTNSSPKVPTTSNAP